MTFLENCNYVITVAKQLSFSMVGIGGTDIVDGNPKLVSALIWQMIRCYILKKLTAVLKKASEVTEKDIITWANEKVNFALYALLMLIFGKLKLWFLLSLFQLQNTDEKRTVKNFKDPKLADGKIIIDLISKIKPNCVDYKNVKTVSI